jgi:DNA (cytosine-5)-methyltransferase 1
LRVVELFAGAGGMSLGLRRAEFEIVAAYDSWNVAVDTYRRNVGIHIKQIDLKDIFAAGPELASIEPDMIVGGPPCQDFSAAGMRSEGERAAMTRAFAMLVCIARPQWFLMENVPLVQRSQCWTDARGMLVRAGYGLTEIKVDASYFNVPQRRKRLIVIGRLGEQNGFLNSALAEAQSIERMSLRKILTDHPEDVALDKTGFFFTRPYRDGRGVFSIDEPTPSIIRTTREKPRPKYLLHPHPADPLAATDAALLTQRQVARIQGFPDWWDWSGASVRDIDQMIANAVPCPLAEAIGRVIMARQAGDSIPALLGRFSQWLRRRGLSKGAVRNVRSRVNRGRRLLGGRTFESAMLEIAALEEVEEFTKLRIGTRSDVRSALKLYRQWQVETVKKPSQSDPEIVVPMAMAA